MRLHRFYFSEKIGDKKNIKISSPEQVNQIRRVFRMKTGDMIVLFDGSGFDYKCQILDFEKDKILLSVASSEKSRYMPERDIYLCASVVKKDTFEWIVEKATELGVTNIVPIIAERSEKKNLNFERLNIIAIEASEQCGRGNVPKIHEMISLFDSIKYFKEKNNVRLVAYHTEASEKKLDFMNEKKSIAIFIGPEGGWNSDEIQLFHSANFEVKNLGQQIFRAETAVICAIFSVVSL